MNWRRQTLKKASSTQDVLKSQAASGEAEGIVVQALEQTDGRGRHGRTWVSQKGNLFFSFLLQPACKAQDVGQISLLIGLAVGEALRGLIRRPEKLLLKWPNDVLLDGKKCAGILLETESGPEGQIQWMAVGVGVNIVSAPLETSARMQDYMEEAPDIDTVREAILKRVGVCYELWQQGKFSRIREFWLVMTCPEGTLISVKTAQGAVKGKFRDVDGQGNLLLVEDGGAVRVISSGDTYFGQD
jgi:BirA family transcriptional regulator, biotin operon repressor / biotin---[acetyl-CoA-carboxylase] ligase